jgi:hypothetical protein
MKSCVEQEKSTTATSAVCSQARVLAVPVRAAGAEAALLLLGTCAGTGRIPVLPRNTMFIIFPYLFRYFC